jgi:hypothetical protein
VAWCRCLIDSPCICHDCRSLFFKVLRLSIGPSAVSACDELHVSTFHTDRFSGAASGGNVTVQPSQSVCFIHLSDATIDASVRLSPSSRLYCGPSLVGAPGSVSLSRFGLFRFEASDGNASE